jgi:hypothetical protein
MTLPTIHRNGTSLEALTASYELAEKELNRAINAFDKIEFNPRDYYPQGEAAWQDAFDERYEIAKKFAEISEYLDKHRLHLFDSQP